MGKEVTKYVREQQMLDREERAAWRDTQKRQAEAEETRRADKLQAEEKKRAYEIKLQIANIEIKPG